MKVIRDGVYLSMMMVGSHGLSSSAMSDQVLLEKQKYHSYQSINSEFIRQVEEMISHENSQKRRKKKVEIYLVPLTEKQTNKPSKERKQNEQTNEQTGLSMKAGVGLHDSRHDSRHFDVILLLL